MEDYRRSGNSAEFNPRASPPSSAAADHNSRWAPLNNGAHFSADPSQQDPASLHAVPRWWVSPSRAFSTPTAVYGGARQLPNSLEPLGHSHHSLHDSGLAPAGRFAADLSRNNPYLDAASRSPSASWRQMQHQQQGNPTSCSGEDDWGYNVSFSPRPAATNYPQAADYRPAYPVAQAPTRSSSSFPQMASANRPPVHPSYGDGSFMVQGDDAHYGWASADRQVRNVGKSQSMRALFEENAALRRALISMRRGSLFAQGPEQVMVDGDQDRYIVNDVAEGRALSMRERGRWAMMQAAAAGEVAGVGAGGNCSVWAGTPRQPWAASAASQLQNLHGGAPNVYRHHRTAHHPSVGWEEAAAAEHPLYSYGGGWSEEFTGGNKPDQYSQWADVHHDQWQGNPASEMGAREGTSLQQLLVKTGRGGAAANGHKWRRQGKKKVAMAECDQEAEGKNGAEEEKGLQCAMCGGKLRRVAEGRKKGGLPLRLCAACHPRAAESLPQSTMRSPPVTAAQVRQRVGTAIFMACRPNANNAEGEDLQKLPTKKVKPAKKKIAELCRQLVGLATGKPSDA